MGYDLKFMYFSKDKQQVKDITKYIYTLYDSQLELQDKLHRVYGTQINLYKIGDYYVAAGCHRCCNVNDVDYWRRKEDKHILFKGITWFEQSNDQDFVYELFFDGAIEVKNQFIPEIDSGATYWWQSKTNLPGHLADMIHTYFCDGAAAWSKYTLNYQFKED